jgi:hypothetical protein
MISLFSFNLFLTTTSCITTSSSTSGHVEAQERVKDHCSHSYNAFSGPPATPPCP